MMESNAPETEMQPVQSSNIEAIGHDGAGLVVQFRGGKRYRYPGVGPDEYEALLGAESVGKAFHAMIKSQYQGEPIE